MFGDILSGHDAGPIGGKGYAPWDDLGDEHALFQACHGNAPDSTRKGKANPTAMFLSAAMMLDWLGERHAAPSARAAARLITDAIDAAFADGRLRTCEFGGDADTAAVTRAVLAAVENDTARVAAGGRA